MNKAAKGLSSLLLAVHTQRPHNTSICMEYKYIKNERERERGKREREKERKTEEPSI